MSRREELIELCKKDPEAMADLILLLEARVTALEKRLNKNSRNSDKPPSDERLNKPNQSKSKSKRKTGAQEGHKGKTLRFSPEPTRVIQYDVPSCMNCGSSLSETTGSVARRKQEIELPEKPIEVIEHQAIRKCCPCCHQTNTGELPEHLRGNVQYGSRFKSFCMYLMIYHLVPYERTSEILESLCGYRPAGGTLQSILEHAHTVLEPVEEHIRNQLGQSDAAHSDETGVRVENRSSWVHVFCTEWYTYYFHSRYRGANAHLADSPLPDYSGTLMHDAYSTYFRSEYQYKHALCNAHLLRELTAINEDDETQRWTLQLSHVLRVAWTIVKNAKEDGRSQLAPDTQTRIFSAFNHILAHAHQQNPHAQRKPGQRGRVAQTDARNLLDRLIEYTDAYLRFVTDFRVPFDNNLAERDLRMIKVHQKIAGSFRTQLGADIFCRIRGYISTLRKQDHDVLSSLASLWTHSPFIPVPAE